MSALDNVRDFFGFGPSRGTVAEQALQKAEGIRLGALAYVEEGMTAMLSMALEDRGWLRVDGFDRDQDSKSLTFSAIQSAADNGIALVTGNPIMHRAAEAQAGYVWGDGLRIKGADKIIKNPVNKRNVFSRQAQLELEATKIATGNVLLLVHPNDTITRIPFFEIAGAVYDPEDKGQIRYFLRKWKETVTDFNSNVSVDIEHKMLYPNMEYEPPIGTAYPEKLYGVQVYQDGVVKHVAPHRMVGSAWGLPDLLAGIFYAGEHKELIEAADSIFRAQSQYAVTYKGKTRKAVEEVAASLAGPPPVDPATGQPMQYGGTATFGSDIEMQLMQKIGAGIDFSHFDPIAGLASVVLGIPLDVVLGQETRDTAIPFTTKRTMLSHQAIWAEALQDIFEYMGKRKVKLFWPKIDPDPTFRQVQSITGASMLRTISPEESRQLVIDTFGTDWDVEDMPDPTAWDKYMGSKTTPTTAAPGSTEPPQGGGNITPGQGQTGQVGKLADGDHSLRDAGQQQHTQK